MANNKTIDQPGSDNKQPNSDRTRNQDAYDTSKNRPNGERDYTTHDKNVQREEEDHDTNKSTETLARERGGHGHSGHSSSRNGSDSGN